MAFVLSYLSACMFATLLSVPIHELGHLVFGLLTGYRFLSFRLFVWLWAWDRSGKIRLAKCPGFGGIVGQCLMEPPAEEKDFRFVPYNLGGGLFNLAIAVPILISCLMAKGEIPFAALLGAFVTSAFFGAMNLIPMAAGGMPNDGRNVREALASPDATHGLYLMLRTNAMLAQGHFMADFPLDFFAVPESADTANFLVAYTILLRASALEEQGKVRESRDVLLSCTGQERLPGYYRASFILVLVFLDLTCFNDSESAGQARFLLTRRSGDRYFHGLLDSRHPVFLAYRAAIAGLIERDAQKAETLIAQARSLSPSLMNPGQEHSVALMLDCLERRMKQG